MSEAVVIGVPPGGPDLTRFWWLPLAGGLLTMLCGLLALVFPEPTLTFVGVLFGIYLTLWGLTCTVRGLFDPKGQKTYGGGTKGPAFKKATTAELGRAIQTAAQEAPKAVDSGRYSRDAKDTVKEYFQNLGGQSPGGNK